MLPSICRIWPWVMRATRLKPIPLVLPALVVALWVGVPPGFAQTVTMTLSPTAYRTTRGDDGGQPARNLAWQDQTERGDDGDRD